LGDRGSTSTAAFQSETIMSKSLLPSLALALAVGAAHGQETPKGASKVTVSPGQVRTILSKSDLDGCLGKEAVVLTVDGKPALVGKKHYHPGDEFIYVIDGSLTLEVEGKSPVTLKAGETIHIPARVVHQAKNTSPTSAFKVVTFGVFEKGKPDTTIVPD
jgi:quercetin dioxygenase-like cupin family protein